MLRIYTNSHKLQKSLFYKCKIIRFFCEDCWNRTSEAVAQLEVIAPPLSTWISLQFCPRKA